ncbi:3-hydroxyacyl-CoA dehydrogenase [Limosilactobacillus sp.]|jgi:3-hydroxybutyryl-CoA dehydrogenase|uniref:3-hydroxyacyl-CoA dehydrogenase n=1 Tax=Limosilactobacillus sp. TaxID=2773925 RepID=UPI0025C70BFF|nr:3-hydroxyacyl-CoA dehydrogenase [Limosilactobacillus sp.]MCH3922819.1 3-hydroxyacyl-CoA dehydrogenase [Limosilactobacillus sp.]MCH3927502.1 3-hydroxyacyl-CoA dehydrogenase [Limosilactobacillus sp.]
MPIQNVVVAGGGVLGSQIAYQTALHDFKVTLYDLSSESLQQAQERIKVLFPDYHHDLGLSQADFDRHLANLSYTTGLETAVADADLVIEAIPEKLTIKEAFYQQLSKLAPEKTIFASNSSSLLPSQLVGYTDRPDRYLHLHFANHIWSRNTAEVMGTKDTDPKIFAEIVNFASAIGMIPVPLHKEQPGYVLNAMLIPWLNSALILWAKGVTDPLTIDRTWMKDLEAPVGPFGILDIIGLRTHYNIVKNMADKTDNADLQLAAAKMKERIDANKLGPSTGEGFYHWPNPAFLSPDFLK